MAWIVQNDACPQRYFSLSKEQIGALKRQ